MSETWTPKYPDFAVDEQTFGRTLEADPGLAGSDRYGVQAWVEAPPSSHCEAFRFFDTRAPEHRWLRRIGQPSELQVRFRAKDGQAARLYSYFFPDAERGRAVFEALCAAAHPWGEVGHPQLVEGKVPYRRRT